MYNVHAHTQPIAIHLDSSRRMMNDDLVTKDHPGVHCHYAPPINGAPRYMLHATPYL